MFNTRWRNQNGELLTLLSARVSGFISGIRNRNQ